jgi:hypothetical protein
MPVMHGNPHHCLAARLSGRFRLFRSISPRQNNTPAKQFNRAASVRAAFGSQNAVVWFIRFQ